MRGQHRADVVTLGRESGYRELEHVRHEQGRLSDLDGADNVAGIQGRTGGGRQ